MRSLRDQPGLSSGPLGAVISRSLHGLIARSAPSARGDALVVGVTSWTVRLSLVDGRYAQRVLHGVHSWRDHAEMIRIDAGADPALVVYHHPRWYRPMDTRPRVTMYRAEDVTLSISVWIYRGAPKPTSTHWLRLDAIEKALLHFSRAHTERFGDARIVAGARAVLPPPTASQMRRRLSQYLAAACQARIG